MNSKSIALRWFSKMTSIPLIDMRVNLTDPTYKGIYNGNKMHREDLEDVLDRSWKNGLKIIIVTSSSLDDSVKALKIASLNKNLYCTVGCHPTRCDEFDKAQSLVVYLNSLTNVIKDNRLKVVALGECGLDNQ